MLHGQECDHACDRGSDNVTPHRGDNRPNAKPDLVACKPNCGNRQNPERHTPRSSEAAGAPMNSGYEKKNSDGPLNQAPAQPSIGAANGKVNPTVGSVQHHRAYSRGKPDEDVSRFIPAGAEQYTNEILSDQREVACNPHPDEGHDGHGAEKIMTELCSVISHAAERRDSDNRYRRN